MNLDSYFLLCIKFKSQYSKHIKIRTDKIRIPLPFIDTRKDFLSRTLLTQALRPEIDEWELTTVESYYTENETVIQVRKQTT